MIIRVCDLEASSRCLLGFIYLLFNDEGTRRDIYYNIACTGLSPNPYCCGDVEFSSFGSRCLRFVVLGGNDRPLAQYHMPEHFTEKLSAL